MFTYLLGRYNYVHSTELLLTFLEELFRDLRIDSRSADSNLYVVRERHRSLVEFMEELYDDSLPLPTWEQVASDSELDFEPVREWLSTYVGDWYVIGDGVERLLDDVDNYEELMLGGLPAAVDRVLKCSEEESIRELYAVSEELDTLYVIRSGAVDYCKPSSDIHPLSNVTIALQEGSKPSYVLTVELMERLNDYIAGGRDWT